MGLNWIYWVCIQLDRTKFWIDGLTMKVGVELQGCSDQLRVNDSNFRLVILYLCHLPMFATCLSEMLGA